MNCPTCERRGKKCTYCEILCCTSQPLCACTCHTADVEYEERIKAEKIGDLRKALKLEEK